MVDEHHFIYLVGNGYLEVSICGTVQYNAREQVGNQTQEQRFILINLNQTLLHVPSSIIQCYILKRTENAQGVKRGMDESLWSYATRVAGQE